MMKTYRKLPMRQWALEDRPSVKMLYRGTFALSDAELLAIIIGSGNQEDNSVDLARQVLGKVRNNLHELAKLNYSELTRIKGIGQAKATAIIAALELGRRRNQSQALELDKITQSNDVANFLRPLMGDSDHEQFWCLFLNRQNRILSYARISEGGITGTVIDVRIVLRMALERKATAIVVSHNHPSGNFDPSESDRKITRQLKESGALIDIPLLDHLIITQSGYYSFADEGLL